MNGLSKTLAVKREVVGEESADQRIDNYLLRVCRGVPKSHIYRILRSGQVRVNGKRIGPAFRLTPGDQVRIPPLRVAATGSPPQPPPVAKPFDILYEDEALIVVNKPAGVAVHGGSGVSYGVIEQLRSQRPGAAFLELAHRLDRETSGLLLVAKKRNALTRMHAALRNGEMQKTYLALVRGRWPDQERRIRLALHKYVTAEGERRVAVRSDGKPAVSHIRFKHGWPHFSLLEVELETGRTHQIRVHLAHSGYPVCGDDKYGDFEFNRTLQKVGLKRMFLHAVSLAFRHPVDARPMRLVAPLPKDLEHFLAQLDQDETTDHGKPIRSDRF